MSIPRLLVLVAVVLLGTGYALGEYLDASQPPAAEARPHPAPGVSVQRAASAVSRTSLPCTTGVRSQSPRPAAEPALPTARAPLAPPAIAVPTPRLSERVPASARSSAESATASTRKPAAASASNSSWGVRSALEQLPSVHSAVTLEAPAPSWEPACAEQPETSPSEAANGIGPASAELGPLGQTAGV